MKKLILIVLLICGCASKPPKPLWVKCAEMCNDRGRTFHSIEFEGNKNICVCNIPSDDEFQQQMHKLGF